MASIQKNGYPDRKKYFVVLGVCNGYAMLGGIVFNSSINEKLPEFIRSFHIPVSCVKYGFLDHDSYFDCSKLIKPRFAALESAEIIGKIDESDINVIIERIKRNPRIRRIELRMFGLL